MNVCSAFLRSCRFVIVCGILSLMPAAYGQAQVGSELDFLNRPDVRDKLTLTETQVQKIEEAAKAGKPSLEFIQGWLRKMEGKTEEEKTQIRKEMAAAVLKAKQDLEQQALDLLDSRQLRLLRSMYVDQAGIRALTDARVAKDLALTEEQTAKLTELNAGRSEASQQLGFSATDEQKDAFDTEWATKFVAVLTPEQTAKWNGYRAEAAAQAPLAIMSGGAAGSVAPSDTPPPGAQIVSSFGSSADAAEKNQLVEKFTFNFRYAPWTQVLQDFAVSTGYTLDMAQTPTGTFSHIDSHEYNVDQTLDIMNGYLQRKGFTLVRKDGFLVCVNISGDGIPNILVPDVSIEQLTAKDDSGSYKVGENELVRVQIVLKGVDVGVMAQEVEALTGPLAKMTALTQSGILIISDTGANLRKINTFLTSAMENVEKKLMFKSYPLANIDAEEAEYMLLAQFGMRQEQGLRQMSVPQVDAMIDARHSLHQRPRRRR